MGKRIARILLTLLLSIALGFSVVAMPRAMARPAPQSMVAMSGKAMPCAHAEKSGKAHPCCPSAADMNKQACNSPCCTSLPPPQLGFQTSFTLVALALSPAREAALSDRIIGPPSRPPKL
jgi:hypothetical protein